jgi:hypothetical protein
MNRATVNNNISAEAEAISNTQKNTESKEEIADCF